MPVAARSSDEPPLRLFGVPRLRVGETELLFAPRRPFQLLALLACRQTWVTRAELAELFWPDRGEGAARGNLRTLLLRARELPGLDGLELQAERVRWVPDSDLQRIDAAIAAGDDAAVLALDGAPLLQGLEPGLPDAVLEWLEHERGRIDAAWRRAAQRQLAGLPAGSAAATRLSARLGDDAAAGATPLAAPVPPAADDGFIGRRAELAALLGLLQGPARQVAVIGPGGIGKSALLRAALPLLGAPRRAGNDATATVRFVALASLSETLQVPAAVAAALGLILPPAQPPWAALAGNIGARQLLLVLDNAEHLPGLDERLADLLGACPGLQLLVASRQRPADAAVLVLEGLPLPDEDDLLAAGAGHDAGADHPAGTDHVADAEAWRRFDAVRLFEARARAAATGFVLAGHGRALLRVLQATEGLPLAIELAARATRLMPIEALAAALGSALDVLDAAAGASSRGLRACFERSWALLDDALRQRMAMLAWLPGPFTREMAHAVAGATLADLAQLLDRCLLRVAPDGRCSMHALLRQFALERAPPDAPALAARHAAHVGHALLAIDRPERLADAATLRLLDAELPHLRAAWGWAVRHGSPALAMRLARVLGRYHVQAGRSHECLPLLAQAVQEMAAPGRAGLAARALVLRTKAMLEYHGGALPTALADARQALRWATRAGERDTAHACLTVLGNALLFSGSPAAARPHFERALRYARQQGDAALAASAGNGLGLVARAAGELDAAAAAFDDAAAAWRALGDVGGQLTALGNRSNIAYLQRDWARALRADEDLLALVEAHGLRAKRALALTNLAGTLIEAGDRAAARRRAEQAIDALADNGEVMPPVEAHLALARIESADDRPARASAAWAEAVAAARRSSSGFLLMRCALVAGELLAAWQQAPMAVALWSWLAQQPQADAPLRAAAQRRLEGLAGAAAPPALPPGPVDDVLLLAHQALLEAETASKRHRT
jgi:predicted ATPase/DNA-binding SARP family transcriptional activator